MSADAFAESVNGLDQQTVNYLKTVKNGEATTQGFKESLVKPQTALGSFAKAATSAAINMGAYYAVSKTIEAAVKAWDNYSNSQENAIEKGKEASENYKTQEESLKSYSSFIEDSGDRFVKLKEGVNSLGENVGLTTDEFTEYNSLASQLAETMPNLVSGYSSLGTPIISTTANLESMNDALREQETIMAQSQIFNSKTYEDAFNAKTNQLKTGNSQEQGLVQKQKLLDAMVGKINESKKMGENVNFSDYMGSDTLTSLDGWFGDANNVIESFWSDHPVLSDVRDFFTKDLISPDKSLQDKFYENIPKEDMNLSGIKTLTEMQGKTAKEYTNEMLDYNLGMKSIYEEAGINLDDINAMLVKSDKAKTQQESDKWKENYDTALSHANEQIVEMQQKNKQELDSTFNEVKPFVESVLKGKDNNSSYNKLDDNTKTALGTIINSMDYDAAKANQFVDGDGNLDTSAIVKWGNNTVRQLQSTGVQTALNDLFTVNDDRNNMTLDDYSKKVESLSKEVSDNVSGISQDQLKEAIGYGDIITDLSQKRKDLVSEGFKDSDIAKFSNSDLDLAWKLTAEDDFSGTYDELLQKMYLAKQAQEDLNSTPQFDSATAAKETENAGDKYVQMAEDFKTAKEAYDQGLTGTDDFKSVAKYLSPTGADDPVNFMENYGKAMRYFTDDAKGCQNFLNDLESKGFATLSKSVDENGNSISEWSYNMKDLKASAQQMGMGFEPFMAMFGRLQDYGFSNNFVSSLEQGKEHITDLATGLAEAEAHLAELQKPATPDEKGYQTNEAKELGLNEGTVGNQTAIDAQKAKIEEYKQSIQETSQCMTQLAENSVEGFKAQVEGSKTAIQTMASERQKILNDENLDSTTKDAVAEMMANQAEQWAVESGLKLDADLNIIGEPKLDSCSEKLQEMQQEAETAQAKLQEMTGEEYKFDFNSSNIEDLNSQINQANQLVQDMSKNEDGTIDVNAEGAQEAVTVLETLIQKREEVSSGQNNVVMHIEADGNEAITTLQEFQQAKDVLDTQNQMQAQGITVDTSGAQKDVDTLLSQVEKLAEEHNLNIDTSSADALEKSLSELSDTELEDLMLKLGVDKSELDEATAGADELNGEEVAMTVKIDEGQLNAIFSQLTGQPIEIPTKVEEPKVPKLKPVSVPVKYEENKFTPLIIPPVELKVNEVEGEKIAPPEEKTVTNTVNEEQGSVIPEKLDKTSTTVVNETQGEVINPEDKEATVKYDSDSSAPDKYKPSNKSAKVDWLLGSTPSYNPPNLTRSLTYTIGTVGAIVAGAIPKANGTVNGFANGTLSPISTRLSAFSGGTIGRIMAHARGADVAIPENQEALINELGDEAIVRDGRLHIVHGGAQMAQLRRGDLIFNHKQTEELVKNKKVTSGGGRAKAFVSGTIDRVKGFASGTVDKIKNAFASGAGGGSFSGGASSSSSSSSKSSSSSNSSSKSSSTPSTKAATQSTEDALKSVENLMDWITVRIERLKSVAENYAQKAENAIGYSKKNSFVGKEASTIAKEISTYQQAVGVYRNKAEWVGDKVGLSQAGRTQVRDGQINIQELDEGTKKNVEAYKNWYDKVVECTNAIEELKQKQKELAQQKLDNVTDHYKALTGKYDSTKSSYEASNEYRKSRGLSESKTSTYYNQIKSQRSNESAKTKALEKESSVYAAELKKAKKIFGESSNEYRDAYAAYKDIRTELYESKTAYEKLNDEIRQVGYNLKQWAIDKWTRALDKFTAYVSLLESRGADISASKYLSQMNLNNRQIIDKQSLKNSKLQELSLYSSNSEKYQDIADEIAAIDVEILKLAEDNEALKDSIRDARYLKFNDSITAIENEANQIKDLISFLNDDALVRNDGTLTNQGNADILLTAKGMELAKQKIANYTVALNKLEEEKKNGVITQREYNEYSNEYLEIIRESANSVADYEQSITDLYVKQIEKRNNAIQKESDKRKEALKDKKDYYEYDKKIKDKSKDISSLKMQIAALSGTTNAAAQAKLERLKADLLDKEDDLNKVVKDHEIEVRIQGYDKLSSDADKAMNDTLEALKTNVDMQQQVVDSMLSSVKNSYKDAYSEINRIILDSGIILSDSLKKALDQLDVNSDGSGAKTVVDNATKDQSDVQADSATNNINTSPITQTGDTAKANESTANAIVDKVVAANDTAGDASAGSGAGLVRVTGVKLSKTSVSLTAGKSTAITATISPSNATNKSVTWSSSNTAVATVSGGTIKAIKAGSATITCKTKDASGKSATCKVKVISKTDATLVAKQGLANTGTSVVNKYLGSLGYGTFSQAERVQLAKDLGISGVSTSNVDAAANQAKIKTALKTKLIKDWMKTLGAETRTTAQVNALNALPKHVSTKYSKYAKGTDLVQLSKILEVGTPSLYSNWTGTNKSSVLTAFKKAGFKKGGVVNSFIPTDAFSQSIIRGNGDDGLISAKVGETVLPTSFRNMVPDLMHQFDYFANADLSNNNSTPNINITYENLIRIDGNVDKEVMGDLNKFRKQITNDVTKKLADEFGKTGHK